MIFQTKPSIRSVAVITLLLFSVVIFWSSSPSRHPSSVPSTQANSVRPAAAVITDTDVQKDGTGAATADVITGTLRVLVPQSDPFMQMSPLEKTLIQEFAASQNLVPMWIGVSETENIAGKLAANQGDIVAGVSRRVWSGQAEQVLYATPWGISRQQVVGRVGSNTAKKLDDLAVRQVALKKSSAAWRILSDLSERHPGMEILAVPEDTDVMTVLERVRTGHYDLAVLDSLSVPPDLEFHFGLEAVMDVTNDMFMTWGVRADATALYKSLNKFVNRRHLELESGKSHRDDFPAIKNRRQLRLITYQSPINYYYNRGRFRGFEYELINRFAEKHGLRLDVIVANTRVEMRELLEAGKGDVIAASLPEGTFADDQGLAFTRAYNYAVPVLVGRKDEVIIDFRDLEDRTIILSQQSPYLPLLQRIQSKGINFTVLTPDSDLNSESVLFRVARGVYDLTVISSHEITAELSRQLNLKAHLNLGDPRGLVWAVRASGTRLLSELNDYIETEYRKGFYNVVYSRYIDKPDIRSADSKLFTLLDQLSPYDEIVHKYADRYSFDWRLIIAQMYQESRFNPQAVSEAGAEGLMQLLPMTAEMIGVSEIRDPELNIHGGIRYMSYLRGRFEAELAPEDRTWFTLASYNAGFNRVKRARKLAAEMNLDRNKWFDNVEIAMLRLATPYMRDGEAVRNCRCGQTVVYVREIKTLYNNYLRLTQSVRAAARSSRQVEDI